MNVEKIIRDYIPHVVHMSLATSNNNVPWVCEVHFAYDNALNLYWTSRPTARHSQEIEGNPSVAGNIVKSFAIGEEVEGVYFEGVAKRLERGPELNEGFAAMKEQLNADDEAYDVFNSPDGDHRLYKLTVKNWYIFGRFGHENGAKYQLPWND